MEDKRKALYNALSGEYNLGTYEDFTAKLNDESKRRALYDAAGQDYNLGTYEEYSEKLGFGPSSNEVPMFNDEPQAAPAPESEDENSKKLRGLWANFKESSKGIWAGIKGYAGEQLNLFTGSSREEQAALNDIEQLEEQGIDVMQYLAEKEDADFQKMYGMSKAEFLALDKKTRKEIVRNHNKADSTMPFIDPDKQRQLERMRTNQEAVQSAFQKALELAGGDLTKAKAILREQAADKTKGDILIEEATETMSNLRQPEGFAGWVGNLLPQMVPAAASIAINYLTKGKASGLSKALGYGTMGGLTLSTAGMSMIEARNAGATNLEVWTAGIADGAIEIISEKIPFDRVTKRVFSSAKANVAEKLGDVVLTPRGRRELEKLLSDANEKLGGKLFSKKNVGEWLTDTAYEAAGEFTAEALQTITTMIYENPEDYPTIAEVLANGWEGAKAGLFMGSVTGGASLAASHAMNKDRRQTQGYVDVAQMENENGDIEVVEVVGEDPQTGNVTILHGDTVEEVSQDKLGDRFRFTYEEFENGRLRSLEDEAIDEGAVNVGQIRGMEETVQRDLEELARFFTPDEINDIVSGKGISIEAGVDAQAAARKYMDDVKRLDDLNAAKAEQDQKRKESYKQRLEQNVGQRFWVEEAGEDDGSGVIPVSQSVEEVIYADGRTGYVVGSDDAGNLTMVFSDGTKGFSSRAEIAEKVNSGEIVSDNVMGLDAYVSAKVNEEDAISEAARIEEEQTANIKAVRDAHPIGSTINVGTEEEKVNVPIIGVDTEGVVVQMPDGTTPHLTWADVAHADKKEVKPKTNADLDQEIVDQYKVAYAPAVKTGQEPSTTAKEVVVEQNTPAEPLPLKADGSVDQTALWNKNPERWAQWNDEQRQDGGANSLAYVSGAIAKEQAKIAELQAAYAAESDFDARDAIEKEIADTQARVGRLTAIQQGYVAQAEAAAAPVVETLPGSTLTARMASEMTQQELNDLDESYDIILSQTRVPEEKARLLQEYLDRIAEGSTPIKVLTRDNYEDVMRVAGCPEIDITQVGVVMSQLPQGEAIAGFVSAGNIFVMADGIPSINEARVTYVHERQHVINTSRADKVREMAIALGDRANALRVLEKFVGTRGLNEYRNDSFLKLADEIIARCMEIAYTTEDFSVDLQSKGLSGSVISIIEEIDNEQRNDKSLIAARRSAHAGISQRINASQDGRDSGQVSGGLLGEEEDRSSRLSQEGTGDGSRREGAEVISEEQLNAPNSGTAQQITAADGEVLADTDGKGGVRFSIRTWNEGGRDYLAAWLANDTILTDDEKADILARMDEFYKNALLYSDTYAPFGTWSDAGVRYDNNGNPLMSVIKANGDYAMNLDFSLVCKKRRPLNRLLRTLVNRNAFATYTLRERELAEINWILQEHGFEVACALCFVDSKRYRVTGVADVFAALYNRLVKSLAPEGVQIAHFNYNENPNVEVVENGLDTMSDDQLNWDRFDRILSAYKPGSVEHKVAQYLREHPEARKLVDATDFIEAEGFESVKENNPDLLKFYNMKKGTGGPKASFGDVQYLNDILKKEKSFDAEKAYAVGGVRLQSFSDFVPHMYFDYMQLFAELAAKKLPLHAYTKEVLFAKIFGLTGAKINMSLVPAVVEGGIAPGLDAEGNYAWADPVIDAESNVIQQGQSFPYDEAMAIQQAEGYSKNCGVIAVGISDAHIEKMLDDPNIPFIIPYHKSSLNAIVARMTNIDQYKDYTNVQNTRKASGSKLDKGTKDFNFNEYLHGLGESGTPQQAAQAYLDWCRENNYKPKFSQFAYHPNYYKLLQDFNTIDLATGEYAPQGAVTMTFPTEESTFGNVETLIQQGLQEDAELEEKMEQEIDSIADQVLARLEEISKEPKMSEKQQAKKMAELADERTAKIKAKAKGPIDLIEEAKKAVAREEAKNNVSFRITPEQDKAYMDAVEAGDMEAAQRMVIEAAKLAMPNTKVMDKKGNPAVVYHGTKGKFNTFAYSREDIGFHFGTKGTARTRIGRGKDARIMQVFLNLENPLIFDTDLGSWDADFIVKDLLKKEMMSYDDAKAILLTPNGYKRSSVFALVDLRQWMNNNGYDGIIYPNWFESNGKDSYIAFSRSQIKSADPVTYDGNGNVIPLSERFNPENEDIRFRFTPRTDEQREQLFDKAKEHYGLTNNFNASGYMLPDGSLLDFSEANDGGDPNRRSLDHRDIEGLIMDEGKEYDSRYHYVVDFVDEGAIRMLPEAAGFQLSVAPTAEQRSKLMDYIYKHNGEVIMEITDENGSPRVYMEYNKRTSPSRIFRDMDGFFNEGIVPGIPPLRFRIANDNQAIFVSNAAKAVEGIKQEKATPEQWLKMIEKNGGLKAGEDKWMGLSDWLKSSDKKTLTKQEVLDFINENMIIINEVHYGARAEEAAAEQHALLEQRVNERYKEILDSIQDIEDYDEKRTKAFEQLKDELDEWGDYVDLDMYNVYLTFPYEDLGDYIEMADIFGVEINLGNPIYDVRLNYTTDGLNNKREIALTVPTIESWNESDLTHFGDAGEGRAVAWVRFGETTIKNKESDEALYNQSIDELNAFWDSMREKYGNGWQEYMSEEEKLREKGIVAKYRQLRKDNYRKVLVIDEIQSKRHQEGREKGYRSKDYWKRRTDYLAARTMHDGLYDEMKEKYGDDWINADTEGDVKRLVTEEEFARLVKANEEFDAAAGAYKGMVNAIPDAPFDKNWHELAMKRMLRYAAENGYDVIAWTKGEQQAERYNLGKIYNEIEREDNPNIEGRTFSFSGGNYDKVTVNEDGVVVDSTIEEAKGKSLSDLVGKDLAIKMMSLENYDTIDEEDLRIGGEGMKGFYDKMLPAFMNKYGKKWGVKVEDIELSNLENGLTMHSVPVTEEMKVSVMEGQVMFRIRGEKESAEDFYNSVVEEYKAKYTELGYIETYPINEETANEFGYTLEELEKIGGNYDPETNISAIFVHEDANDSVDVKGCIFHEQIHFLAEAFPYMKELGKWMRENAETSLYLSRIKETVDAEYEEYWKDEEMLSHAVSVAMAAGVVSELEQMVPQGHRGIISEIEKEIGYDRATEESSRRAGQNLSRAESEEYTGQTSEKKVYHEFEQELSAEESIRFPERVHGVSEREEASPVSVGSNRQGRKSNASESRTLTAEERRVINEYFPGAFRVVDSNGNTLTPAQEKFFVNSKAVDKDGNLLVLYHGTPRAGFTEFKSGWFTTSKEDAISYSGDRKGRLFDPNEKYEPETLTAGDFRLGYMTFDSEEDRAAFLERFPYADEVMSEREYEDARMGAEDEEYDALTERRKEFAEVWNAYREYERERFVDTTIGDLIANPEAYTEEDLMRAMLEYDSNATFDNLDEMSAEERKDALVSALQNANEETEGGVLDMVVPTRVPRNGEGLKHNDLGNRTYEVYANIEKPYEIDANGRGSEFESGDIYKSVEEALADEQYDGVIIRNWRVGRTQQLGDVVVPKNGSQIKLTSNENPSSSSDIRFRTSLELDEEFGDAWRNQQNEDGRHSTQVANTKSTYEKIGRYLEDAGMKGASILDASSGLGLGTQALREMGFQVDDVEPFPSENREAPTYSSYADIEGQYDVVISNAVLNVIPDDWRADVLHQMADAVKEGGKMIINTRPASNIAQQGVEGKTRITLDSPSEILVKRGDRIAAYQKGFTSEELAEWIKSELGEGWRVEKATKKNSGISGEGTAVVIRESEDAPRFRTTGTPTDVVVANGLQLTSAQTAEVAANIFAALPEESRKKITEGLNGNVLGLKDAILQIPASLASKENWNDEDKQMADVVAEEMTKIAGEMTRPFSAEEGLWLLYNNFNKGTDLISQASRALVQRNLGFDAETLAKQEQAKEGVRFRTVGDATSNALASLYNRGAVNVWTRLKESFVDMQASVEELVKAIEKRTGKVAQGFENILLALNQQSSKGLAAMESYTQKFLKPMFDEIRRIMDETKMKYEDVVRYVILKHGLERNKKLAQRDARAHYQEIYDDIISKITGMTAAQKRTYLTNAQLKEADAKAELATLQAVDMSAMTDEEKREHKKKLAAARKAVEETEEHLKRAQKIASLSEQEAQDELDKIFEKIENGTDSVFKEMRENDYSGISSMFYDQLGVDRKNFSTEEQYQAALMEAKKDRYSSLKDIEAAAEAEVKSFEGKTDTKELWKRINAATKETLRQQYEANMISKDQYLNLRDMFEYYVPLRGFKDNTAEDMYTYYRKPNSTGYTKPILGAEGRKTEAESPFGWIAAMAGSAIASNVKNEAKLALFYFVSNRPENGIATISKTWFVDSGEVDERGKKIFKPAYPPFSEDLSSAEGKAQYEIWQANMKELQKKGQAYEAGQRLNLGNAVVNISDTNKPEHIVNVKVGGKDYTIIVNGNPRAAQAINGDLNIEGTAQDYSALFGPVLRWMSSVNTSYNPEFWITNMMRDMAFTMMAVNIKEDPAYRRKFSKNYRKAFKVVSLVAKNEKGTIGDSYLEQQYKDFVKYGGVTGYTQIKDSETWEQEIENYLSSTDPESLKSGKVMRGMKSAFHAAHRFGESLEQVSRFAAFLTARETGKSINEAINDAKEITVNFNRKGSGKMITLEEAKYLTGKNGQPLTKPQQWMVVGLSSIAPLGRRFIMFFNAAIQGLNATYKLMKKNPKRFTGWALGYAAVGMMNAVLHAMLDDDDDYLDIPQYERRNSLMIGGNGAYFKWALPQEARAFYALGDLAVETVMGRNPHQNFLGEALKIGTEILPVNPSEGWKAFMPSVAIPFIELALNEDYKGAPIYNDQKWLSEEEKERTAKWSNAYQGTGWTYVKIAQGLNFITGGDKHDAGWINLQPEKLEHLVQSAFGGTIRTADKFINTISAAIDPDEPVTVRQFPFVNRFLTINDERFKNVHVNDVFDYYKADAEHALTLEKQYIKDRDMDSLTELRSSDEYQWAKIYGKYKKPLKAIQDKIKVADGTAEKKELMKQQDELKKRMIKEISEL